MGAGRGDALPRPPDDAGPDILCRFYMDGDMGFITFYRVL
jgi:hypothetical protein